MDDYNRGGHCKFSLKVHEIFVSKYRKQIFINKNISDDLKQYFFESAKKFKYNIMQIETDKDHIHILLDYHTFDSVSNIVKNLKQYSIYIMWQRYKKYLSKYYWKHQALWSDGYFACSIGQVSQAIIEKYIQNQG